jgi:aryl-alcohol dehydrogenase-like predicted oxidoreductase
MINRRKFVRISAAAAALSCFPSGLAGLVREKTPGRLEKRELGRTGEKISIIGFGGIVVMNATSGEAAHRVAEAFEMGVNYFDVAPSYGNAEQMLGPALKPFRNRVYLSCKTQARDAKGVREELEDSLRRMQTDHFDLYQLHAVTRVEDVDRIFARNGALEAFLEAKEAGKIRHIGFSAHSVEASEALLEGFDFDTIMFPINYATWHAGNFGPQVLEKAKNRGMGILALKATAKRPLPEGAERRFAKCWYEPFSIREEAAKGLGFTLSHPVTSAIPPGDEDLFRMALDLGLEFEPLGAGEIEEMKRLAQEHRPLFTYPSPNA